MKMRFLCAVAVLGLAGVSQAALADDAPASASTPEFAITGSASVVSQYRWRGLSQSNNAPAFQGSLTVTDKSGFYISTWGSSTYDSNDIKNINALYGATNGSPIGNGGSEIDVFGGYSGVLGKSGVTVDGGLYGYIFPNAPEYNNYELYGDLSKSYGPIGAKVGLNWAPSQAAFDSSLTHYNMYEYFELTYSPTKLPAFTLHGHIGHTGGSENYLGKEYLDFSAGASYKWKLLTFDISAVGTNIGRNDATNYANLYNYVTGYATSPDFWRRPAKTVAVASVTANF